MNDSLSSDNVQRRNYTGIEIFRLIFACLIPILHIEFSNNIFVNIIRQYLSRLGVPFFFVISGMFLSRKLKDKDSKTVLKEYFRKIIPIMVFWVILYTPLIVITEGFSFREYIFRTPAYLWYLTSLFVAVIPFCLIRNRVWLHFVSFLLYIIGTILGDTYGIVFGVYHVIHEAIITTRNGIFFGLPMLCVGELVWGDRSLKKLLISSFILSIEITFVGFWGKAYDRSMYISLPLFMLFLVRYIKEWNPHIRCRYLGHISSLIYLMQYGIITITNRYLEYGNFSSIFQYLLIICVPVFICLLFKNNKKLKKIC